MKFYVNFNQFGFRSTRLTIEGVTDKMNARCTCGCTPTGLRMRVVHRNGDKVYKSILYCQDCGLVYLKNLRNKREAETRRIDAAAMLLHYGDRAASGKFAPRHTKNTAKNAKRRKQRQGGW